MLNCICCFVTCERKIRITTCFNCLFLLLLKYIACFHYKAEYLITIATSRKSAECQAEKKVKKPQSSTIPQNPHVHHLTEMNVLWECWVKIFKECHTNSIVRFFALGKKAACEVTGSHIMLYFRTCPLPVNSWLFLTLDSIIHCRGEMVGQ